MHNAKDVAERVDHRSSNESHFTTFCEWFIFFRSHSSYLFKCRCHIVDVPVYNRTSWTGCSPCRCVLAVNDAKFVLVVASAELNIRGVLGVGAFKVWLYIQQLSVPLLRCFHVCSVKIDSG